MRYLILLPCYNEAENINDCILGIFESMQAVDVSILVIDDNSPDGTAGIVKSLFRGNDRVKVITGKKEGLGKAYIRGIKWALKKKKYDYLFEMDADLSHNPKYLEDFVKKSEEGYDFIIGSRYIKGGSCLDWSFYRKSLSFLGNLYIRAIGGLWRVSDCTSGFRCISTRILRAVNLDALDSFGYSFQMELLDQSIKQGAKIVEIPILFQDRKRGDSKLGILDGIECIRVATLLRKKKYDQES